MPGNSYLTKLINCEAIVVQPVPMQTARDANISIDVLRLDLIHPIISGNKYFKLKNTINRALHHHAKGIVSFGGAYSNHLVALAYLCNALNIPCVGVVRGEEPRKPSFTLQDLLKYQMKLHYLPRAAYSEKNQQAQWCADTYPQYIMIPEGGQSDEGVAGAAEILEYTNEHDYDVICCAVGTGTMMAGLLKSAGAEQKLLGISALKIKPENEIESFIARHGVGRPFSINYDYHFGGYAKSTGPLISFMNQLWREHRVPTDFVYTGKMFYAISDLAARGYFESGTRILAIHSGGLQGNRSLKQALEY